MLRVRAWTRVRPCSRLAGPVVLDGFQRVGGAGAKRPHEAVEHRSADGVGRERGVPVAVATADEADEDARLALRGAVVVGDGGRAAVAEHLAG